MKHHLALFAAIVLSIVVFEITSAILRARAEQPFVAAEPSAAPRRRDPLDGLVPPMRVGIPRPTVAP